MRLLVAEDEKPLADALCEILTLNKYSVDVVYNGVDALNYINSEMDYDGIILDIMMPKKDGISVLREMRNAKNTTPVLILTAKSEIDDMVCGLDSGADDYLTKPFNSKELLARIRAMTRKNTAALDTKLTVGNITLNCVTYELIGNNGVFSLTNKEFQLMELLFNNVGRYISTEHMMEKIWGPDSESEINVVWSHLSGLRKKLEKLGADITIKSSRNLGYTVEVANG